MPVPWWMRVLAATGMCIALAAVGGGAQARELSIYRGPCGEVVLPNGPTRLDPPVAIETSCGRFVVSGEGVRVAGGRTRSASARAGQGVGLVRGQPLGWTRAGLRFTASRRGLTFWTRAGRAVMRVWPARKLFWFEARTGTVVFVSSREDLMRTDGRRVRRLRSVAGLELGRRFDAVRLPSGRIALLGARITVLAPNGAVVASGAFRPGNDMWTESPSGVVAVVSTHPAWKDGRARESIRLLSPRGRSTVLFADEFVPIGCGSTPSFLWSGESLLYATAEGTVVVVDTRSRETVDLTSVVARLPGEFVAAAWT
jgi:hypothetical protein